MMKALVFVRKNLFLNKDVGHVGWCFQWDNRSAICGATENPLGTPHTSAHEKGAWHTRLPHEQTLAEFTMGKTMYGKAVPPYDRYKVIDVHAPDPQAAWNTLLYNETLDYWLTGNPFTGETGRNCMDDTYDILRSFGCPNVPTPQEKITPYDWFAALEGPEFSLWHEKIHTLESLSQFVLPSGIPQQPLWRTPGTDEYKKLQQEIIIAIP